MFSSLRTRLWFSYALLIIILLLVVAVGITWAFLQSPRLLYPEAVYHLRVASETLGVRVMQELDSQAPLKRVQTLLQNQSSTEGLRVVVTDARHNVLLDTGGVTLPFTRILRADQARPIGANQVRTVRQQGGGLWLYMLRHYDNGDTLIVLTPAPAVPLALLYRDQFFSTFLVAALLALALAFILALLLGNWITAPLRRMVTASQAVARGEYPLVPVKGPVEVQELASAMNEMSHRVQTSQQSQRDFVANVSHELKTPLTSIQGFAQAILDGAVQTPEALKQAAGVIYHESDRMHRLVLDLLSLARLEAGTADLQHAPVDLSLLLGNVAEQFAPQASSAQVQIHTELQSVPGLLGDGDRLAQVFTNLVDNAIKFTPPGGSVTLADQRVEESVQVTVADSGPGIAPEDQTRIFERFYQVDKSRRGGAGHGTGLGLAIARQIVIAHGGKIWVESQPGQGSRFVVKIPLARADASNLVAKSKSKR